MNDSSLRFGKRRSQLRMYRKLGTVCLSMAALLSFLPSARAQTKSVFPTLPATCPIRFVRFTPSNGVRLNIRNTSGKTIVGLVFNAALADAAEDWKWYHWDFNDYRPVRDFGWNKTIDAGATKRLSWAADLDFQHGSGGAFVLTSVLFGDGSRWQARGEDSPCMCLWYSKHKKTGFVRPVRLPPLY